MQCLLLCKHNSVANLRVEKVDSSGLYQAADSKSVLLIAGDSEKSILSKSLAYQESKIFFSSATSMFIWHLQLKNVLRDGGTGT